MENIKRYNDLSSYLKNKFGERVLKICIDGNFTCPNRDGKISTDGCIFCSEKGSGEHLTSTDIQTQVLEYFKSYKSNRANKFIVYFQNFTNTYDTLGNLKKKYNSALIDQRIIGLSVATRPDCITEDICKLLSSYSEKYYVSVELGLQTANNHIGQIINRGYSTEDFIKAVKLLNKYHIDIITHIMIGLPFETLETINETIALINSVDIQGLKIHSTYVVKNTKLASMFFEKTYIPITLEYYLEQVTYMLSHINPNIVIHRVSGDAPKDLLIAPEWNLHKKWIINGLDKILKEKKLYQGIFYKN